jgi:hypothetical protein
MYVLISKLIIFVLLFGNCIANDTTLCNEKDILKIKNGNSVLPLSCIHFKSMSEHSKLDVVIVRSLVDGLRSKKHSLESIDIRRSNLSPETTRLIIEYAYDMAIMIEREKNINVRLKEFHLGGNILDNKGWEILVNFLKISESLEVLGLEGTRIESNHINRLAVALYATQHMREVRLEHNVLTSQDVEALVELSERNPHLHIAHSDVYRQREKKNQYQQQYYQQQQQRQQQQEWGLLDRPPLHTHLGPLLKQCGISENDAELMTARFHDMGAMDALHLATIEPSTFKTQSNFTQIQQRQIVKCICTNYLYTKHAMRMRSPRNPHDLAKRYVSELCRPLYLDLHRRFIKSSKESRYEKIKIDEHHKRIHQRVLNDKEDVKKMKKEQEDALMKAEQDRKDRFMKEKKERLENERLKREKEQEERENMRLYGKKNGNKPRFSIGHVKTHGHMNIYQDKTDEL